MTLIPKTDHDGNDNDDVLEFLSTFKCFESPTKTTSDPSSASLPIKSSSRNRGICYIAGLLYWMYNDVNTASKHSRGLINSTKVSTPEGLRMSQVSYILPNYFFE